MNSKVQILDTTLRDGAQGEGISFSAEDKLAIIRSLDSLGIGVIEAGNPGSSDHELDFFRKLGNMKLQNSAVAAFGSTRRKGIDVRADEGVSALVKAGTGAVAVFGKSFDTHVKSVLECELSENLSMIEDTVSYLKSLGRTVIYDAEHFFDACKANRDYAYETLGAAMRGGADFLALCDTNGGAFPDDISNNVKEARGKFGDRIGIHCHNDCGMAVANSIIAVTAGAVQVHGTMNGIGERCGNASLSSIIPNLQVKMGRECIPAENLSMLTMAARRIAEISNITLSNNEPFIGSSAFAHKAGMHVDAMEKLESAFEHITPESVGNERRMLTSGIAGRTAVYSQMKRLDPQLRRDSGAVKAIMSKLRALESAGYQFELADASLELIFRKQLGRYKPFFELLNRKIIVEQALTSTYSAWALIKIKAGDSVSVTAAEGDGPVEALDKTLRQALCAYYPEINDIRLIDFKVRVIDSGAATSAKVRVLITTTDGADIWTTIGVSTDIIEASLYALVDSIEYKLLNEAEKKGARLWD